MVGKTKMKEVEIDYDHMLDFVNLAIGLFAPLEGFMNREDFGSVVEKMTLAEGSVFTVPIILPIGKSEKETAKMDRLRIMYESQELGFVEVEDVYKVKAKDFYEVFKTTDKTHPGLNKHLQDSKLVVGGHVELTNKQIVDDMDILTPKKARQLFSKRGWKTVAGFQTRNAVHRGHEHLQRIGLELCDGLFINPLMGWKKSGDLSEEAIDAGYRAMIEKFYPKDRVFYYGLRTAMRYAGPREALFHALIRRNQGCTHFIIGRDHAGVGGYYGVSEAVDLARELTGRNSLGIELLTFDQVYYCSSCGHTVTRRTCSHNSRAVKTISGTLARQDLRQGKLPSKFLMRKEVAQAIINTRQPIIP